MNIYLKSLNANISFICVSQLPQWIKCLRDNFQIKAIIIQNTQSLTWKNHLENKNLFIKKVIKFIKNKLFLNSTY